MLGRFRGGSGVAHRCSRPKAKKISGRACVDPWKPPFACMPNGRLRAPCCCVQPTWRAMGWNQPRFWPCFWPWLQSGWRRLVRPPLDCKYRWRLSGTRVLCLCKRSHCKVSPRRPSPPCAWIEPLFVACRFIVTMPRIFQRPTTMPIVCFK